MILVTVDTSKIQSYIFGSNRLRENIGASHLVAEATGKWAEERAGNARIIYSGGGNFLALFESEVEAGSFANGLSRKVLADAPGLRIAIALSRSFDLQADSLKEIMAEVFSALGEKKRTSEADTPLLGLGVTAACRSTGLPAAGLTEKVGDDEPYPASTEILAKRRAVGHAKDRLDDQIGGGYEFPSQLDDLGRSKGEFSYIAVAHIDGDGMGKRFQAVGETYSTAPQNEKLIDALHALSNLVNEASLLALRHTVSAIGSLSIWGRNGVLPFRPLVFGGDDVTFVCDGRLGVGATVHYIRRFEEISAGLLAKFLDTFPELRDNDNFRVKKMTACGGVSIVKSHYPFAGAYRLAEDLTAKAKAYKRKIESTESCVDWHFATGGLYGDIDTIRKREFKTNHGSLTMRPVTIGENKDKEFRSWRTVEQLVSTFQSPEWKGRRNKMKGLRDALRMGPEEVERFIRAFRLNDGLPPITSFPQAQQRGWVPGFCPYFDPIELADFYVPFDEKKEVHSNS